MAKLSTYFFLPKKSRTTSFFFLPLPSSPKTFFVLAGQKSSYEECFNYLTLNFPDLPFIVRKVLCENAIKSKVDVRDFIQKR